MLLPLKAIELIIAEDVLGTADALPGTLIECILKEFPSPLVLPLLLKDGAQVVQGRCRIRHSRNC